MMTDDTSAAVERLRLYIEYDGGALPTDDARAILAHIAALEARAEKAEGLYQSEYTIVDRIWQLLGNPSYEELGGRSIYDLIDALKARAKEAEAREATLRSALEKIADEQKVYRGHGDYTIEPAYSAEEAQGIARQALAAASAASETPSGGSGRLPAVPPAAWLEAMARAITETLSEEADDRVKVDSVGALRIARAAYAALAREMGDGDAE